MANGKRLTAGVLFLGLALATACCPAQVSIADSAISLGMVTAGYGGYMPGGDLARRQVRCWSDADGARLSIARRMYAWRLGEVLPHDDIAVLRGIEGARMKETYRLTAQRFSVPWHGRRYDRSNPGADDVPNQAINHAATAVEAAATIAVTATATVPQLGFIHEDSGQAFVLDIADLYRDSVTLPVAFRAAARAVKEPNRSIDRLVRQIAGETFRRDEVIPGMIEKIKELFGAA